MPITNGMSPEADEQCDIAVVGGGILGLAVARELTARRPQASVCVLERESELGTHQTGHNSGVIHAGVYYVPGSLKAQLCVAGAREMYEYCERKGIASERCGKVIVATDRSELERLEELERRGRANGVPGLRRIDADGIRELEPHARGIDGLHSPGTGIADFAAVARAYAGDVQEAGGTIATGCEVLGVGVNGRALRLSHSGGVTEARNAIFCAGAWADRLAVSAGADPDPRIVPFRGAYLRLRPERRELVRSLIYPVPDPALPFLGVHLTKHIDGEVLVGPTALMAGARDAYRLVPRACARRARHAGLAGYVADARALVAHRCDRAAPCRAALGLRSGRVALCPRAARWATSSRRSPACARRRSHATASSWTTSSSRTPSARCTCATRRRRPRPPRWRSPATSRTKPSARSPSGFQPS